MRWQHESHSGPNRDEDEERANEEQVQGRTLAEQKEQILYSELAQEIRLHTSVAGLAALPPHLGGPGIPPKPRLDATPTEPLSATSRDRTGDGTEPGSPTSPGGLGEDVEEETVENEEGMVEDPVDDDEGGNGENVSATANTRRRGSEDDDDDDEQDDLETMRGMRTQSVFKLLAERERTKAPNHPGMSAAMVQGMLPSTPIGQYRKVLDQYRHHAFCGQFSKDGTMFMTGCQDQHIRVYDIFNGWKQVKDISARDVGWSIIDTDYSPDQRFVIYSSWSEYGINLANIYGEHDIHERLDFRPNSNRFCLFSIQFSPDSREILGGSSDQNLYVFDIESSQRVAKISAHEDDINSVAWADGSSNILFSGSDDCTVKVWDRRSLGSRNNTPVGAFLGHTQGITHVSSKGDGRYLISNSKDQTIKLWDIRTMTSNSDSDSSNHRRDRRRRMASWDYRSNYVPRTRSRLASYDRSLMTYTGHQVLQTLIRAYFSPEATTGQRYIYSGSADGRVYIFDLLTGEIVRTLRGHTSIVRDVSWHPNQPLLLSTSWDGTIGIYEHIRDAGSSLMQNSQKIEAHEEDEDDVWGWGGRRTLPESDGSYDTSDYEEDDGGNASDMYGTDDDDDDDDDDYDDDDDDDDAGTIGERLRRRRAASQEASGDEEVMRVLLEVDGQQIPALAAVNQETGEVRVQQLLLDEVMAGVEEDDDDDDDDDNGSLDEVE